MAKKNTDSKNIMPIVGFSVLAVILLVGCLIMMRIQDENKDNQEIENNEVTSIQVTEATQVNESWETKPVTTQTEAVETTPAHVSPQKLAFSENGSEVRDLNVVLDKDKNKIHKIDLKDFADEGDELKSVTFYFSAEDGVSNMGLTKGGFGISVSNKCPLATDNLWYQPEDFAMENQGVHASVTWNIPDEIREYITVSNGKLQFGYWWSNVNSVILERVVCEKDAVKTIPCDDEKDIPNGTKLAKGGKLTIPVKDLINENEFIQTISVSVSGADPAVPCEISANFGIPTGKLFNGMYHSYNMRLTGNKNKANGTWIIPDAVLKSIDYNGNIEITITESNIPEITVDKINIQLNEK